MRTRRIIQSLMHRHFNILAMLSGPLIITGDANICFDRRDDTSLTFIDLITAFGLMQHVNKPMNDLNSIMDVVFSRAFISPSKKSVLEIGLTDHHLIQWHLDLECPQPVYETTVCRLWRYFNVEDFRTAVKESELCDQVSTLNQTDASINAARYNAVLEELLDRFVPETEAICCRKKSSAWFSNDCWLTTNQVRKLEWRFHKTNFNDDHNSWISCSMALAEKIFR